MGSSCVGQVLGEASRASVLRVGSCSPRGAPDDPLGNTKKIELLANLCHLPKFRCMFVMYVVYRRGCSMVWGHTGMDFIAQVAGQDACSWDPPHAGHSWCSSPRCWSCATGSACRACSLVWMTRPALASPSWVLELAGGSGPPELQVAGHLDPLCPLPLTSRFQHLPSPLCSHLFKPKSLLAPLPCLDPSH